MLSIKPVNRAVNMPFREFKQRMSAADPWSMDYFVKYDGFHLVSVNDPYGGVEYFTKWGTPLATGTVHPSMRHPNAGRTLRAINTYLLSLPDRIDPQCVERDDVRGTARQVNFELVAIRNDIAAARMGSEEWMQGAAESLQDLFHGKCVNADETLNTVDYTYGIRIFDVTFKTNIPVFARVEAAANAYGLDMTATQIFSFKELVPFLNGCEGVVAHMGGPGKKACYKIKVPCPIRARIVGVKNTLADFAGWDKILVCVENQPNECFDAVCEIDLTEILTDYTRPSKGKVYANPQCVKYSAAAGTVVYELAGGAKSTSVIAPMLNALYGLIGKATRFPPIATSTTVATIRIGDATPSLPNVVRCGGNRSFGLAGYEYLVNPIDIIMGVNDVWSIANNQLHLQAPSVLCLPDAGYGSVEFMGMPHTTDGVLRTAATQRLCRDRVEYYKLVGLPDGPFKDLVAMAPKLFCAGM